MNNVMNYHPTRELQRKDFNFHIHPFSKQKNFFERGARIITHGEGIFVSDSDGNKYLDAMAGLWCVNIGYGRKELVDVAARQMFELPYYNTFFQSTHIPVIELSERLASLTPGDLNHVFYANSGSEANDTNIRIVRHFWRSRGFVDKTVIISRKNAYHGSTIGGASLGGMEPMHSQGDLPIRNIVHINQPDWWSEGKQLTPFEFGILCAKELEDLILEYGENRVAAFIAEPIQGAGGVIVPPDSYWPEIQKICNKYNILLIVDEVICGFGRTGNWFGSQTLNIEPDIITVAKGLSSGYLPIGGSIVTDEIAEVLGETEFNHGYTYSGHPVAAAVALENLRILEEEHIIENVRQLTSPYLKSKWESLSEHPLVGEAKIVGMMASIALTPNQKTREKFKCEDGAAGVMCREHCYASNLIMRAVGDRMIISPPLIISCEEIDILYNRVTLALDKTYDELKVKNLI